MANGTLITGMSFKGIGRLLGAGGRTYDRYQQRKEQTDELTRQNELYDMQISNYKAESKRRDAKYQQQIGQTLSLQSMEATLNAFTGTELAKQQLTAYKDILAGSAYNEGQAIHQSATSGFRNTGTNASLHAGYREESDGTAGGLTGSKDTDVARTYRAIQNRNAVKKARDEYKTTTASAFAQAKMQYLDKTYRIDQLRMQKEQDANAIKEQISFIEKQQEHNDDRMKKINDPWAIGLTEAFDWVGTLLSIGGDIMTDGAGTFW